MNEIRTAEDAAEYAVKVIPRVEGTLQFFHNAARMSFQGALISLIRLQGITTPQAAKALCSDVDRLRETLERDPEAWRQCCGIFAAGREAELSLTLATLQASLHCIPESTGALGLDQRLPPPHGSPTLDWSD
jgi:hypothetical protein